MNSEKKERPVLVVDDERGIRETLKRFLTLKGFDVDLAENGVAALEALARKKYHVVVTDIQMPEMDGIELLREIRSGYPMTHCIVITGYVTLGNVLTCMRLGADTCIFKPFQDLDELLDAVRRAVDDLERWEEKLMKLISFKPRE